MGMPRFKGCIQVPYGCYSSAKFQTGFQVVEPGASSLETIVKQELFFPCFQTNFFLGFVKRFGHALPADIRL